MENKLCFPLKSVQMTCQSYMTFSQKLNVCEIMREVWWLLGTWYQGQNILYKETSRDR